MATKDEKDEQPQFLYWPFPGGGYVPRAPATPPVPPRGGSGLRPVMPRWPSTRNKTSDSDDANR